MNRQQYREHNARAIERSVAVVSLVREMGTDTDDRLTNPAMHALVEEIRTGSREDLEWLLIEMAATISTTFGYLSKATGLDADERWREFAMWQATRAARLREGQ